MERLGRMPDRLTPRDGEIHIIANGTPHAVPPGTTIADLIAHFHLIPKTLLVERNGTALHRSEWPTQAVEEGDRIEFIKVVAGG